jgi:hypothetical protein
MASRSASCSEVLTRVGYASSVMSKGLAVSERVKPTPTRKRR